MTTNNSKSRADTREAAEHCGVSASGMSKLRVYGGGPRYYKIGRRVVYDLADLDTWLNDRLRQSTSEYVASRPSNGPRSLNKSS